MVRLVPDVLPLIFSHLTNWADLARCARVCKEWLDPARTELYFETAIDNPYQAQVRLKMLRLHSHLADKVRELVIKVDGFQLAGGFWPSNIDFYSSSERGIRSDQVLQAIQPFNRLRKISISEPVTLDERMARALSQNTQLEEFSVGGRCLRSQSCTLRRTPLRQDAGLVAAARDAQGRWLDL